MEAGGPAHSAPVPILVSEFGGRAASHCFLSHLPYTCLVSLKALVPLGC